MPLFLMLQLKLRECIWFLFWVFFSSPAPGDFGQYSVKGILEAASFTSINGKQEEVECVFRSLHAFI